MVVAADLYAVLGVSPDADTEVIHAAWRALVRKFHPDLAHDVPDAAERTRAVNEAHDVLGDPNRRIAYDLGRHALPEPNANLDPRAEWVPPAYPMPPRRSTGATVAMMLAFVGLLALALTLPGVPGRVAAVLPGDGAGIAHFARASLGQIRRLLTPAAFSAPAPGVPPAANTPIVAPATVTLAASQYARVSRRGGVDFYSQACAARAANFATWEAQDYCAAFDLAAGRLSAADANARYAKLGASPAAAAARVTWIRKLLRRAG